MAKHHKNWSWAIKSNDIAAVKSLISTSDINEAFDTTDPTIVLPLHTPLEFGVRSFTPLTLALKCRASEIVKLLVGGGADVNKFNHSLLKRPLDIAAKGDDVDIILFLIENGADVNSVNDYGFWKPLSHAIKAGKIVNVKALIKFGATAEVDRVWNPLSDHASNISQLCTFLDSEKYVPKMDSAINYFNIAKFFLQPNQKNSFNLNGNPSALNYALEAFSRCNQLLQKKPGDGKAIIAKELSAEILMLMANSPMMTDSTVKKTAAFTLNYSKEFKLPDAYKTVLEEHPMWSIYNSTALINALDHETRVLNHTNFERCINAKKDITDTLLASTPNFPKDVMDIVIGYASESDIDFSAAYHMDQITVDLLHQTASELAGEGAEG